MKVLIIGEGGREHALLCKIKQNPKVKKIYCAPGNAGTGIDGENVNIKVDNLLELKNFAIKEKIDLTIVGPEISLVLGIVDLFQSFGLKIFGPSKNAAEIEGSKCFSKNLMKKYGIPSANYEIFDNKNSAIFYLNKVTFPIVIKVDGLAAGKGVLILTNKEQAISSIEKIFVEKSFGTAGNKIIIEEYLEGEEVSILCFSDGKNIIPMISSQDHKKIFDGDKGPNTGGMGSYAPTLIIDSQLLVEIENCILKPTIKALELENRFYSGILYAGLMLTKQGLKVLEFNCRFGDPETQVILPLMKNDLIEVIESCLNGELNKISLDWHQKSAVCVVLSSANYPGNYEKGKIITGLEKFISNEDLYIFHAGTKQVNEKIVTNGGRVLGITGLGTNIKNAIDKSYKAISEIYFDGMYYRKDIADKAVKK